MIKELISEAIKSNLEYGIGDDELKFDIDSVKNNFFGLDDITIYATHHTETDKPNCKCKQYVISISEVK